MAQAAEAGLQAWEPLLASPEDALRVGDLASQHGLAMVSIFLTGNLHDAEEAVHSMDRMVPTVRAAAARGCRFASVYPAPVAADPNEDKSDDQLIRGARHLEALGAALRAEGVQLLYHPEEREMRNAAREFHHMLLATDSELVGLCLDPDAVWRGAGKSMVALTDVAGLYGHRVKEVHVRQSQGGAWSETVGPGDLDYEVLAAVLGVECARPLLVLEHAAELGTPSMLDPVEAHRRSRRYVEDVFGPGRAD